MCTHKYILYFVYMISEDIFKILEACNVPFFLSIAVLVKYLYGSTKRTTA